MKILGVLSLTYQSMSSWLKLAMLIMASNMLLWQKLAPHKVGQGSYSMGG